jgi:hypothetical protein
MPANTPFKRWRLSLWRQKTEFLNSRTLDIVEECGTESRVLTDHYLLNIRKTCRPSTVPFLNELRMKKARAITFKQIFGRYFSKEHAQSKLIHVKMSIKHVWKLTLQ